MNGDVLILKLKELFDVEGKVLNVDYQLSPEKLSYCSWDFKTPVFIKGEACNRAGIVTLCYTSSFTLDHVCDRCLSEFEREYNFTFNYTLVQKLNDPDKEGYIECGDNMLNMDELAASDLLVSLSEKVLCKEDCKGLCIKCGKNLNEGDCDCVFEEDKSTGNTIRFKN